MASGHGKAYFRGVNGNQSRGIESGLTALAGAPLLAASTSAAPLRSESNWPIFIRALE
jgi:hypothetical protein